MRQDIEKALGELVIGQEHAVRAVAPYVEMFRSGLAPEGRPAAVFMLLGPTGTGKTYLVESLAKVLHGNDKHVLRVDCGEFQMEHEVAKLIGAPPGYLGHRETQPILSQTKLNAIRSETSGISLVLFDEIEKASQSMQRMMLGILDKATLRLGDNSSVNFENTMIFMTSNLGAKELRQLLAPTLGLDAHIERPVPAVSTISRVGAGAAKRRFSPEFMNRIDEVVTYEALTPEAIGTILEQQLWRLDLHIQNKLQDRMFDFWYTPAAREYLIAKGFSTDYGARELKRVLLREVTQPLALRLNRGEIAPGDLVKIEAVDNHLTFEANAK